MEVPGDSCDFVVEYGILVPSRLVLEARDRQVFENDRGARLEIHTGSNGGDGPPVSIHFQEGAPLPACIVQEEEEGADADEEDGFEKNSDLTPRTHTRCCFRTSVSNDNRLHVFHYVRAALLTLLLVAVVYSSDAVLTRMDSRSDVARRRMSSSSEVPTVSPTLPTTYPPAVADAADDDQGLLALLERRNRAEALADDTSPQYRAYLWMTEVNTYESDSSRLLLQRYAVVVLDFALHPSMRNPTFALRGRDECDWTGVRCDGDGVVTGIKWPNRDLHGAIPDEIGLLKSLELLDLGENAIRGSIPGQLYALTRLSSLYLHQNLLTGPLSSDIEQLYELENFYASDNRLTGMLPSALGSVRNSTRPLRYLILSNNDFSGSIPSDLRLRNLFYLDLGRNRLNGTVPADWLDADGRRSLAGLRHLYLDHNHLTGSLPADFAALGNGRMNMVHLNDNRLTGTVPGGYTYRTFMHLMALHHNNFTTIEQDVCNLAVWVAGEMASLTADCGACDCEYFCQNAAGSGYCLAANGTETAADR